MIKNDIIFPTQREAVDESNVPDVLYFRRKVIPDLSSVKYENYVAVRTFPKEDNKETYTLLLKKDAYRKYNMQELLEFCKKYTEYESEVLWVSELTEYNIHRGEIKLTSYEIDPVFNKWMSESRSFKVRTEDSLRMEKDEATNEKRNKKIA